MLDFCNGKEERKKSVNDDLDSFFEDLCLGKNQDKIVETYYLPLLTEEELDLIEQNNYEFMNLRYNSKWPKTAVTEIGPRDLICIQTSKWPKYCSLWF